MYTEGIHSVLGCISSILFDALNIKGKCWSHDDVVHKFTQTYMTSNYSKDIMIAKKKKKKCHEKSNIFKCHRNSHQVHVIKRQEKCFNLNNMLTFHDMMTFHDTWWFFVTKRRLSWYVITRHDKSGNDSIWFREVASENRDSIL